MNGPRPKLRCGLLAAVVLAATTASAQPAFHDGRNGDLSTGAAFTDDLTLAGFGALWIARPGGRLRLFQADGFERAGTGVDGAPTAFGEVSVTRHAMRLDKDTLRFADEFLNFTDRPVEVDLVWGGAFFNRRGKLTGGAAFLGRRLDAGPVVFSIEAPVARRSPVAALVAGPGGGRSDGELVDPSSPSGTAAYPGADPTLAGLRRRFTLEPGERVALVQFVLLPREKESPAAFERRVRAFARAPDLSGLSTRLLRRTINWPGGAQGEGPVFNDLSASIAEIGEALSTGKVTVRELAERRLARIGAYDRGPGGFNAFIRVSPRVYQQAEDADRRLAMGEPLRPLEGVMLAVKDSIDVEGLPTSLGLPALAEAVATRDAEVVARMRAAGAIVVGKTNLDELILGGAGLSTLGGQTLNAFDRRRGPGGSSGGSAVAVAAGMATLALGTDTCDSLSNPAGLLGLATLRGTHGSVPPGGVLPFQTDRDIAGVLARSVDDLERAHRVIAAVPAASGKGRGVATLESEFTGFPGQTAAGEAVRAVLAASGLAVSSSARDFRAQYRALRRPNSREALDRYLAELTAGRVPNAQALLAISDGRLNPASRRLLGPAPAAAMSPAQLDEAVEQLRRQIIQEMDDQDVVALAYPANLVAASLVGTDRYPDSTCAPSSQTGLPQLTAPACAFGPGATVGVSLLGRPGGEDDLFAIARRIEAAASPRPALDLPEVHDQPAGRRPQ